MRKKLLTIILALAMILSIFPTAAMAAEGEAEAGESKAAYVLMNIPYAEFYAAEGIANVDAVSTATVKTYNQTMAAGSYHAGYEAADPISDAKILGVTYPVYVEDITVLKDCTAITDESTATITVASGKSSTAEQEVSGKDLLFASGDYAYYVLAEEPANYKTLSVADGKFSFSAVKNAAVSKEGMKVEISYGGHHTDIGFTVSAEELSNVTVTGVILTTSENEQYVLRHVEDIWKVIELGWNWNSLDGKGLSGKTIKNVTYYLQDGSIYSYDVDEKIKQNTGAKITAEFEDAKTVAISGLPEGIENPKATIATKVGKGETPVVVADAVEVKDGKVTLTADAVNGTTYTVKVVSDKYADLSTEAAYTAEEEQDDQKTPETPAQTDDKQDDQKTPETPAQTDDKQDDQKTPETPAAPAGSMFTDVPDNSNIFKPVNWAVKNNIVKGFSDGTFKPEESCTREQFAIMMWRFAGQPDVDISAANRFSDIAEFSNNTSRKAVAWAVSEGVINGFDDGTFKPLDKVTRRQVVVMLWRWAGRPAATETTDFSDVQSSESTYKAIQWGSEAGLVKGYSDGTFKPEDDCQRQHIVIFLYRYAREILDEDVTL